jgi:tRNA dimethylallyltransferase
VYRFQQDFRAAFSDIISRGKQAVMCGGTGMYLESVILNYEMTEAPVDHDLRIELEKLTDDELIAKLNLLKEVHNITDTSDRKRLIRAIEIALTSPQLPAPSPQIPSI